MRRAVFWASLVPAAALVGAGAGAAITLITARRCGLNPWRHP